MAKQTDPAKPNAEQQALIKGKTPRNAILSIGLLAALVIGGLGFYYELKASDQAQEDARLKKAAALKSSAEVPGTKNSDIDQLIRQQQEAAASEAAARAASDAAAAGRPTVKPVLTSNDFKSEVSNPGGDTRELSKQHRR
jgi:type IV secretion system protein VirB10